MSDDVILSIREGWGMENWNMSSSSPLPTPYNIEQPARGSFFHEVRLFVVLSCEWNQNGINLSLVDS